MSPHPDDLDGFYFLQQLVHEAVLNGDATGISSGKVSNQLFISPLYHPGFSLHFLTGVFRPFRMDSLIPGTDKRYHVS
jgi:hypothetical protein